MNSKLPQVGTTIFTEMSALAQTHNAVNLSQGFPNFKVDQKLLDYVSESLNGFKNQYAPMPGLLSLRENIILKYEKRYNINYSLDNEITITAGATQAIFTIISSLIEEGDEVIIFDPAYDCYDPTVELFKGKSIHLSLKHPEYKIDWAEFEESLSSKTKLVIINSPHNPTGSILSESDLQTLNALIRKYNFYVLSDEVYEHIIFDEQKHRSVCLYPELKKRSYIVGSFGKTFHVTGWKLGYCIAPKEMMVEFRKVHQFNVFCVNHPMQDAIAKFISKEENYNQLEKFYQEKRDYFLSLIKDSKFKPLPSKGTYFILLDYSEISDENDVVFAKRITKEYGLATIPTSVFYQSKEDNKVIRVCFAKTKETLEEAAKIINSIK